MEPRDRAAEPGPPWPPGSPRPPAAQAMDSPYANGAYSPPYPPAPGAAPHYTGLPQTRGYYCSAPSRTPYPAESTGMYRPSSPAPPWSYGPPDCPAEGSSLRRQQVPGYSPPQTPGMPIPQYPYGDSNPGVTAQGPPPQPRPPEDTWAPPTAYGVQPRYAWPAASVHGNPFISESHPPWTGSGASSHPSVWDSKDTAYNKPEQSANQHNYYSDVNHQHSGTMNDHKPATPLNAKPSPSNAKVQYSAQPQMYDTASRKLLAGNREAGFKPGDQPSTNSAAIQPEIQRILHVMGEAEQLGQEVDEFVGKKTDKSYRLLEEMLTKLLLELDSIETGGQDSVRQARKESVHRIQAILEKAVEFSVGVRILFISRKKITVQSSPNQAQSIGASCSLSSSLSRNTCQMWSQRHCNVQPQTKTLGFVSHCVYFQLQLPRHKNLCVVVGFCLVLVHSSAAERDHAGSPSMQADVTSCCSSSVMKSQSMVSPVDTGTQPGNLSSATQKDR